VGIAKLYEYLALNAIPTCKVVATLLLQEWEDDTHTPEMGAWESTGIPKTSEFNCKGQNILHWGVFYIIGSYQSVDIENGLAGATWTSAAKVMPKRKVASQIGNLTPNH
jgi:hypothetical protein